MYREGLRNHMAVNVRELPVLWHLLWHLGLLGGSNPKRPAHLCFFLYLEAEPVKKIVHTLPRKMVQMLNR